jgi:hypothetical protein
MQASTSGRLWPFLECPFVVHAKYVLRGSAAPALGAKSAVVPKLASDPALGNWYLAKIEGCTEHAEQCRDARPLREPAWDLHPLIRVCLRGYSWRRMALLHVQFICPCC